mmetsp:Transcript_69838/g.123582  ORF Transcript_69838/g.123582 Transcript_69838/m.123582 type:complete len:419 (-) Transcript_69838:148-1404(-)|eukprot:CAMPEP_0197654720 /NCGR_PEP_ID=MMETSP1338-20131121/39018_1 /TAXON_ID=43686 ORGANISM="Pelagodinium beii, Strain RCC1491" /NCGR_SAMPLE_ID=MMETSP1338 /ASSEMBLY_ACC=CAM_ASM_000754 /LENGTH=418 /DNA_ID=CAMNT_0043230215 /DNA_START=70 /DNA_END=1326 /DNA_ORIENTATION=+
MASLLVALLPMAVMAGLAPPSVPELISLSKQENFAASLAHKESSLMTLASQVTATYSTTSFQQLQEISNSLESMSQSNLSKEVTTRFLVHMFMEMDKLQETIPDRLKIYEANLDKILAEFHGCEADRLTKMNYAVRHEHDLPVRVDNHEHCREEEAAAKLALDSCYKEMTEIGHFLSEDTTCAQWPAMKALKPVDHTSCSKLSEAETYEEYLERVRNELDNQLMLFRELKNACSAREEEEKGNKTCQKEKIAHEQKKSLCNVFQAHLEKESCDHATEVRGAWNEYSTCYQHSMQSYVDEVAKATQVAKEQQKQWHESVKIRCTLGGLGDNPKQTTLNCPDSVPETLKLKVKCPPELEIGPYDSDLPTHTDKSDYHRKMYADIPVEAPLQPSTQCHVPKEVVYAEPEVKKAMAQLACTK